MRSRHTYFPLVAAIFVSITAWHASPARAALCGKCRDMMFTESQGRCIDCGGPTSSGALQLCPKCSAKRHQCEHCLARLSEKDEAAINDAPAAPLPAPASSGDVQQHSPLSTAPGNAVGASKNGGTAPSWTGAPAVLDPPPLAASADHAVLPNPASAAPPVPAAQQLKPINPARPGSYTAGKWRFQLQITNPGTRSEGRWGWLTYDGQKLPRGGINDFYFSPWGPMYWVGAEKTAWGLHGFMPVPSPQNPRKGRVLALPIALVSPAPWQAGTAAFAPDKVQTLEINRSHNGQITRLRVGNVLIIRLPGNPASGYQWQVGTTNTQAVRLTVPPQYSPPAIGSAAAAPGTYTFIYQAVQPGAGPLRLYYVRPNDRAHARDAFAIGIQVATTSPASRPASPTGFSDR
jgi:inhibitor of cysteine peptidase